MSWILKAEQELYGIRLDRWVILNAVGDVWMTSDRRQALKFESREAAESFGVAEKLKGPLADWTLTAREF